MPKKPTTSSPKVTARKITDYQPDPQNPNAHNERGIQVLDDSLSHVGLGRSIVVDRNGIVLAGNSTQERAVDQGFENAIEIESDGTQLIVVKRTDLDLSDDTGNRARQLSYYDNRSAETGIRWDIEQVQAHLNEGLDLAKLFNPEEMARLLEMNTASVLDAPEDFKTFDETIETQYCCPKCGYRWSGKADAESGLEPDTD